MTEATRARLDEAWENLPLYLGEHVLLSMVALGVGIAVSLPLAVWASRKRALRWPILTVASVIQTIPSIALLALFYPLLVIVSYYAVSLGAPEFSALGFLPSVLALTLYSMLPILRNTVTGIIGVDPAITEAARGMGMTPRQVLFRVELPLAAPVIIAGVRTATVWVIGIATLSTPVGQTSLGNYIFTGLQIENWTSVLFGCVAAAVLAIVLDQLIGGLEKAAELRSRALGVASGVGLFLAIAGGLVPGMLVEPPDRLVGAKTFSEQFILADLIESELEEEGLEVASREGLGSTVIFQALVKGDIDVYVDYSGTIWANHMRRRDTLPADEVLEELERWLEQAHGVRLLGALGFDNAYGLAMRRDRAEELGVETIADLALHSASLTVGGDYEFFGRPEWESIEATYGLRFAEEKQYQSTFMYKAVEGGEVDVISAFTSDGRIAAYDLVVLEDPRLAIPPYDAVLLLSPDAAKDERVVRALEPYVGAIDIDLMRRMNQRVDVEGAAPEQAARELREAIEAATADPDRS